jgi:hypothetical protein
MNANKIRQLENLLERELPDSSHSSINAEL